MKFNHNKISYSFDDYCIDEEKNRMIKAFKEFSSKVPVSFFEKQAGDIEISCNEENRPDIGEKYFVAGEGGAKKIIQTGRYNVINDGIIFIYEENKKSFECDYPGVELHELMHVFGFDHSSDKNSLMYPYLESCDQRLDQSIIDTLKKLYSTENLADLYFEDVNAVKKGRYLDFNLTVRNSGDIDANNANFSILDDGSLVESKSLGDVKYGAGIFIEIKNFKLIHRNPKEISFVIDYEKKIKEIDESNNVADVKFE